MSHELTPPPGGRAPPDTDSALPGGPITVALRELRDGADGAQERLMGLVHAELRRIAKGCLRRERNGHDLQTTDLLHEAYLRLLGGEAPELEDRRHLYAAFAQSVRRVLVDHARARAAAKRGGEWQQVSLSVGGLSDPSAQQLDVLAVHEALEKLCHLSARQAHLVELRFFGGFSISEVAQVLGVGTTTVDKDWAHAKAWLHAELSS